MKKNRVHGFLATGVSVLFLAFLLTDCTSMITQDQLAKMEDLRRREASIKSNISKVDSEISALRNEMKSLQGEVDKCKKDTEFVNGKLSNWPNVWPQR